MKYSNTRKSLLVTWKDVTKQTNDEDFHMDENLDNRLGHMETIGFLYSETKNVIMLVQEFCEGLPRDWIIIPKCLIISTKEI